MKWMFAICLMSLCAGAQQTEPAVAPSPADKFINYSTDKKSVQYIVIDMAKQVGLGYNWEKSFSQTDPECRRFVFNVSIKNQPFQTAMGRILGPASGHILFHGDDVRHDLKSYQRRIGYVPEEPHLYPHLSGREYLQLTGRSPTASSRWSPHECPVPPVARGDSPWRLRTCWAIPVDARAWAEVG